MKRLGSFECCNNIVTEAFFFPNETSDTVLPLNTMKTKLKSPARAFSLIELLVVMAVVSVMVSILLPVISGFSGSAGRRGAVNTVMNTFEQARVAALESGRTVYIVFWRRVFPEADALMVLREPEDGSGAYEPLTRWMKLPNKILLHQPDAGESMLSVDNFSSVFDISRMPQPPVTSSGENLNVLAFNESGGVAFPLPNKSNRKLIISEGVRDTDGTEALIGTKGVGGFEIISVSRYTGRSQLDITTLQ